ncbi:nose resistant to fluoxetine protein 6-like [Babylonia areolata]|uniref:nose resistant to fluoxetine protein 6-like n=1 Tax=Babylonia areolata TaxID=304850 RepID=UPI003FD349EB
MLLLQSPAVNKTTSLAFRDVRGCLTITHTNCYKGLFNPSWSVLPVRDPQQENLVNSLCPESTSIETFRTSDFSQKTSKNNAMKTPGMVPATLLVLLQLFSGFPECSTSSDEDSTDQAFLYPTYVQRFQILSQLVFQARDPEFEKNLFQFQKEVSKGLNSLTNVQDGWAAPCYEKQVVSAVCANHTTAIVNGVLANQLWASQFLDAMGKPPAGLLQGATHWPGAYEQCMSLRVGPFPNDTHLPPFSGKYCTASVRRTPTASLPINSIQLGICIPDSCSATDMTILIRQYLTKNKRTEKVSVTCIAQEDDLDTKAIVAIVICSALLACMAVGTVLDVLLIQRPKWQQQQQQQHQPHQQQQQQHQQSDAVTTNGHSIEESLPLVAKKRATKASVPEVGTCSKLLMSFSVYTNAVKLLSTDQPAGSLTCVHGIRFLSMTWVVLGHAFAFIGYFSVNSYTYTAKVNKRWTFQAISNATVSVDSFFVLSGLLVSYLTLKEMKKKGVRLNWFLFYFHRFWRLTPAYMLVIMVFTCLSPYWGSGPFWSGSNVGDRRNCEDKWWTNLLYINNLVHSDKQCLGQSWYLANDMQFYILSPLIFVPFYFSPLLGCISSAVFVLTSTITPGVLESNQHFSPGAFAQVDGTPPTEDMFSYLYAKPWNRMGPYVIGLMTGYVLFYCDCKLRINKFLNLFLWAVATGTAMAILYGLYDASNGHPLTVEVAAFYSAVTRTVWGACVAWVVIACCTGNGGLVNMLLSWKGLVPLSRLTYTIYLLHIMIMDLFMMNQQTLFYMSDINIVMFFLGILVVSYLAAFVTSLAFEAPMMGLEKILFRRGAGAKEPAAGEKSVLKHSYYTNGAANFSETKLYH